MARRCMVATRKDGTQKGSMRGNHVSHSNRKVRRDFKANVRWKRVYSLEMGQWVRVRLSSKGLRMMDKLGVDAVLKQMREKGQTTA